MLSFEIGALHRNISIFFVNKLETNKKQWHERKK